jgi:peptide/nickel transport system ATP-binding protein/oligopeptide transport system ATP-binding protein
MPDLPLLDVVGLGKIFRRPASLIERPIEIRAVDDVTFSIARGETLGLVGESGCGKTTTGRMVVRLLDATSGTIVFEGQEITRLAGRELRALRRGMQIVFQDPMSSLNPRMTAGELVTEPLVVHGEKNPATRTARLNTLFDLCGLSRNYVQRFPHEFSGGQRQRIVIARALALNPKFLVLDEAVSALDVSIQAQILNLLMDLKDELALTYLFISHDLGVVRHIADRVAVMYLGKIVELAPRQTLFATPAHPYTQALLAAAPGIGEGKRHFRTIAGDVPSPSNPPPGCHFHTRCPKAAAVCRQSPPELREVRAGQAVACHFASIVPSV